MSTTTILGVFEHHETARHVLEDLKKSDVKLHDTSLVTPDAKNGHVTASEGAVVGATWGGLVGLAALLIPGVGPFIVGGAIGAALTGAVTGAVVGGVAGALIHNANLPEHDAKRYEGMVHEGKTLVVVKVDEADALAVRKVLAHEGAESIRENETDMTRAGLLHLAMYDEHGREMHYQPGEIGPQDVVRTPELLNQQVLTPRDGTLVSEATADKTSLDTPETVLSTSGRSGLDNNFDDEDVENPDSGYANGARVVSYEDSEKPVTPPEPTK